MSRTGSLDCHSFENRIHQILDNRQPLTGDRQLMQHVGHCAECRKILQDYESVDDSVKLLPAEIAQIIAQAQANTNTNTAPLASRRTVVLATLAAMIVIALNVMHQFDNATPSRSVAIATPQPAVHLPNNSHAPSVQNAGLTQPKGLISPQPPARITPDSSPFSPEFSFVSSMPRLEMPPVPSWDDISKGLDPLGSVFHYSLNIPTVPPVPCSLNTGLNLLKRSLNKPERKPDLGLWIDPSMLAAV